jgi:hypothetical protein
MEEIQVMDRDLAVPESYQHYGYFHRGFWTLANRKGEVIKSVWAGRDRQHRFDFPDGRFLDVVKSNA